MKKLLYFAGLVVAAALSCVGCSNKNEKVTMSQLSPTTTFKTESGETVELDSFVVNHYDHVSINNALAREQYVSKVQKKQNAADFGKKRFVIKAKTLSQYDFPVGTKGTPNGEVSVIHYQKGVEVVRDGKSWFYDFAHFRFDDADTREYIAAESVLHPGVWEPVETGWGFFHDIELRFVYSCGYEDRMEKISYDENIVAKQKIKNISDLVISKNKY